MPNPCKPKPPKRYTFSSAAGMQNAGSGLKMPCNRTLKIKTSQIIDFDQTDKAQTTVQSQRIDSASNGLLDHSQTLTKVKGTKTQATTTSAVNYSLDANANLTNDGLRSFDYDAADRLSKTKISKDGEAASITYLHNTQGQRIFKSEPKADTTLPNDTNLGTPYVDWLKKNFQWPFAAAQADTSIGTAYSFADESLPSWALLGEYDNGSASGKGRTEYLWLPLEDGGAVPIGMYRSSKFFAVHADHLGTPRLVTNDTNTPVWQWPYSAFGNNKPTGVLKATANPKAALTNSPTLLRATAPTELNLRFAGQYADDEAGNFYNYFRNYQPEQGRYTQGDPIGLNGGLNRFGYVGGNALGANDPTGLEACPGGIWDEQKADWGLSLAAGGFFSSTNVNYVCRSKPSLKVSGKQTCIGGGPILGAGFGGTLGGTSYGADDSSDLGGWARHQGQFSFGPMSVQAPVNGDAGGSVSIGKSIGGGAAYSSCYTKIIKTSCEAAGK